MSDIFSSPKEKSFRFLAASLCDGIEDKNLKQLSVLLEEKHANPNVEVPSLGITPFHLALLDKSEAFSKEAVKLILMNGGDPNVPSKTGKTPLHIAATYGRIEIVKLLLNNGGNPLLVDKDSCNPFHYAFQKGHSEVVALLCEYCQSLQAKEEEAKYNISLEKVILNDGNVIAEYSPDISKCALSDNDNSNDTLASDDFGEYNKYKELYNKLYVNPDSDNRNCEHNPRGIPSKEHLQESKKEQNCNNLHDPGENSDSTSFFSESDQSFSSLIAYFNDSSINHINNIDSEDAAQICETNLGYEYDELNNYDVKYKEVNVENKVEQSLSPVNLKDNVGIVKNETDSETEAKNCVDNKDVQKNEGTYHSESGISNMSDGEFKEKLVLISEEYKYSDVDEKVNLLQRRYCTSTQYLHTGDTSTSSIYTSTQVDVWYPPETSRPDKPNLPPKVLRQRLIEFGQSPGPITTATYEVYLKRFIKLSEDKRNFLREQGYPTSDSENDKVSTLMYNLHLKSKNNEASKSELLTLDCTQNLLEYERLEAEMCRQFERPSSNRQWREGISKNSFNYLLLDPRVTQNLPRNATKLSEEETWQIFLSSIFYIGKGKRTRPYAHLYDAFHIWTSKQKMGRDINEKCRKIMDIWNEGQGVIALHIFQNIIPVEAYTREALMIEAMGLHNLANCKNGEFYGVASMWSATKKRKLGKFLLHKAMEILMLEGEKQIFPDNI